MNVARIEFLSEGERVKGRFFCADGSALAPTLLLVPGWPGNSEDVLGMGKLLSEQEINVCMFNPRGFHESEGLASFPNALKDIGAAWHWLGQTDIQEQFKIDPNRLSLGGYSWGGGMALAYAAQNTQVQRVISFAGNDHGVFIREVLRNPELAGWLRQFLQSTLAPEGPVRCDIEADIQEMVVHQEIYGLQENAARLAGRSVLLVGGWEDNNVTIENILLPFYRALKQAGSADCTFYVYHTDHGFSKLREQIAADVKNWLLLKV